MRDACPNVATILKPLMPNPLPTEPLYLCGNIMLTRLCYSHVASIPLIGHHFKYFHILPSPPPSSSPYVHESQGQSSVIK